MNDAEYYGETDPAKRTYNTIFFDTEDPEIGERITGFQQWIEDVLCGSKKKSFDTIRHTHFAVPQKFVNQIGAPKSIDFDENGFPHHDERLIAFY